MMDRLTDLTVKSKLKSKKVIPPQSEQVNSSVMDHQELAMKNKNNKKALDWTETLNKNNKKSKNLTKDLINTLLMKT